MKTSVAIIAALPREVALLVRGVAADPALKGRGIFLYRLPGVVVVVAGMGASRVALGVEAALTEVPGATLISVGLSGSCSPELAVGSVVEVGRVVDVATGERFDAGDGAGPLLATTDAIASVAEKARLAASYGAVVVDMEAATVARLARAHGVGFRAIKAVSDANDFELESLGRFTGRHGSFRTGAFVLHTAVRPWTWGKTVALGRNSAAALRGLDRKLAEVLASASS